MILHLLSAFLFLSGFYSLLVVYYPFCLLLKHHCVLATMQSQVFGGDVTFKETKAETRSLQHILICLSDTRERRPLDPHTPNAGTMAVWAAQDIGQE